MILALKPGRPLRGTIRVPGDKSLAHRALLFAVMAEGVSVLSNMPDSGDVRSTRECLILLGARIRARGSRMLVAGRGSRGFLRPGRALDAGNSGTTARLLLGLLAGQPFQARLMGDASLRRRPMARAAEPLRRMGARIALRGGDHLPALVRGADLRGILFSTPVPSAQLKSAVLIAGLLARGRTSVKEPLASRDHTERLLPLFGVPVRRRGSTVSLQGPAHLRAASLSLPGDASSAAYWAVAATLVPGSRLRLPRVGCNPTRMGFRRVLARMGARIASTKPTGNPEPACDLLVSPAPMKAVQVRAEEIQSLLDEIPILAVAASQAQGTSRFLGLAELRHKESDRLLGTLRLLRAFGAQAGVEGDSLLVAGSARLRGVRFDPQGDHRLAMAAAVAGLVAEGRTTVLGADCIAFSYPEFGDTILNSGK